MNALWITLAMLVAGFVGWPVTALVFRLARTIDDRTVNGTGAGASTAGSAAGDTAAEGRAEDPAADSTDDVVTPLPAAEAAEASSAASAAPAAANNAATNDAATVSSARILRGGAIIGVLERFAVCMAILVGEPVAIAYVVAIKGLGRFAELKDTPVAAERFIIGTLTSMLWAAGVAALVRVLVFG